MMKTKLLLIAMVILTIVSCTGTKKEQTNKSNFDFGWKFSTEFDDTEMENFDDSAWQTVNLPHDWSIEGPFSKDNPSFSRGGWLPAGKCSYRKSFNVPENELDKRFVIYFDGAYRNSEVYINGQLLGKRPLGYIAFHYNMTEFVKAGENVITVKLDNSTQPGSRWYTGTGIYRHVYLIKTEKLFVPVWGTYITANDFDNEKAHISIETKVTNEYNEKKDFEVKLTAFDKEGAIVATKTNSQSVEASASITVTDILDIDAPQLWNTQSPYLYTIKTEILLDSKSIYSETNKTGIRKLEFDSDKGFILNGEVIKLKGVCLHHDGGPLGAAVYKRTIERQLEILREMGCNAVRTAHNPFSEEFLDVCDEMGFLVMNEMFDEWEIPKAPATSQNGEKIRIPIDFYASQFKEWADRDLTDFLLRDRNHPSVIMWSIGNEIDQMMKDEGAPIGQRLADIVHALDYRPVTNGVFGYGWNAWPSDSAVATSDIKGYNYIIDAGFDKERALFPEAMAIVTECESAQSYYPRGTYLYGTDKEAWWDKLNYENSNAFEWAERREFTGESGMVAWAAVKKRAYVMGQFIWTGWDYLGEVIPFGWPARSSSFAPLDLCGFPKDGYYFYQSQWTEAPMVHIFPHWNHTGHEGDTIEVHAFTNGTEVELFQDGVSLGKQNNNTDSVEYQTWKVIYQPGELKAVTFIDGKAVSEKIVKTTGEAAKVITNIRRTEMAANGQDLIYVECSVVDADGNVVPTADNMVNFTVSGPAILAGVGNGNNMSHEPFKANYRKAFNGHCLVILQSAQEKGDIKLTIESDGLEATEIGLKAI